MKKVLFTLASVCLLCGLAACATEEASSSSPSVPTQPEVTAPYLSLKQTSYETTLADGVFEIPTEDVLATGYDGEEVSVSYSVTHNGENVPVENATFKTETVGVYSLTIKATDAEGDYAEETVNVTCYDRNRDILYDFEQETDVGNFYAAPHSTNAVIYRRAKYQTEEITAPENGGEYALSFTATQNGDYLHVYFTLDRALDVDSEITFMLYCDSVGDNPIYVQSSMEQISVINTNSGTPVDQVEYTWGKWMPVKLRANAPTKTVHLFVNLNFASKQAFVASSAVNFYMDNFAYAPKLLCDVQDYTVYTTAEDETKYYLEEFNARHSTYRRDYTDGLTTKVYGGIGLAGEEIELLNDDNGDYFLMKKGWLYEIHVSDEAGKFTPLRRTLYNNEYKIAIEYAKNNHQEDLTVVNALNVAYNTDEDYVFAGEEGSTQIDYNAHPDSTKYDTMLKVLFGDIDLSNCIIVKWNVRVTADGAFSYGWTTLGWINKTTWYEIKLIKNGDGRFSVYFNDLLKGEPQTIDNLNDIEFWFRGNSAEGSMYVSNVQVLQSDTVIPPAYVEKQITALPALSAITYDNLTDVEKAVVEIDGLIEKIAEADRDKVQNVATLNAVKEKIASFYLTVDKAVNALTGVTAETEEGGLKVSTSTWAAKHVALPSLQFKNNMRVSFKVNPEKWTGIALWNANSRGLAANTWTEVVFEKDNLGLITYYVNGEAVATTNPIVVANLDELNFMFTAYSGGLVVHISALAIKTENAAGLLPPAFTEHTSPVTAISGVTIENTQTGSVVTRTVWANPNIKLLDLAFENNTTIVFTVKNTGNEGWGLLLFNTYNKYIGVGETYEFKFRKTANGVVEYYVNGELKATSETETKLNVSNLNEIGYTMGGNTTFTFSNIKLYQGIV